MLLENVRFEGKFRDGEFIDFWADAADCFLSLRGQVFYDSNIGITLDISVYYPDEESIYTSDIIEEVNLPLYHFEFDCENASIGEIVEVITEKIGEHYLDAANHHTLDKITENSRDYYQRLDDDAYERLIEREEAKKYELSDISKVENGVRLYQIQALYNFNTVDDVKVYEGQLGGWVESEANLDHKGYCWVADNAVVCGDAKVVDDALIKDNAFLCDRAKVCGSAVVEDYAEMWERACAYDNARISGDARIYNNSQIQDKGQVYGNAVMWNGVVGGRAEVYDKAEIYGQLYDNAVACGSATVNSCVCMCGDQKINCGTLWRDGIPSPEEVNKCYKDENDIDTKEELLASLDKIYRQDIKVYYDRSLEER